MGMELSSVDVRYAVKELTVFVGAKLEKVFQSDENKHDVLFQFYCADGAKRNLRLLQGFLCVPRAKPSYPQVPPGFAMFLRKRLGGTRITGVEQVGFDRIIRIGFERKRAGMSERFTLVIELIPPGNVLLIDTEGRIINLLENQQFKDRSLRTRQPYAAPPPSFDIAKASDDELAAHITASTRDSIVTTLAIHCGLGGVYAEEACARSGIAKHRNDLSQHEVGLVVKALREALDAPLAACKDEHRAYPFILQSRPVEPCEESSFLSALCEFVEEGPILTRAEAKQRTASSPRSKLQVMADAQEAQAARLAQGARRDQRKGELLFQEYAVVQEMLQAVRDARESKQDVEAALKRFPQFISYNKSNGLLEIELGEPDEAQR